MANFLIPLAQAVTVGIKLAGDTITGLFNGTPAPADSVAQYAKAAFGAPGVLQGVDADNPLPVNQKASGYVSSALVTRPANITAYTAGDVVGGAIELASLGPAGGIVLLTDVLVFYNVAALPAGMGALRLHLYSATPPSALADNAPFDLPAADRAAYLNYIDLPALQDWGSTLITRAANGDQVPRQVKLAAGQTSLWGYLQTIGGFTPAANSETLRIDLDAIAL